MNAAIPITIQIRHWARIARSELRSHRRVRLALLRLAAGMSSREVLHALVSEYDVDTIRVDGRWFLVGPEEPSPGHHWSWWVCGPAVDEEAHAMCDMAFESWIDGFTGRDVLAFCRGWNFATTALHAESIATT